MIKTQRHKASLYALRWVCWRVSIVSPSRNFLSHNIHTAANPTLLATAVAKHLAFQALWSFTRYILLLRGDFRARLMGCVTRNSSRTIHLLAFFVTQNNILNINYFHSANWAVIIGSTDLTELLPSFTNSTLESSSENSTITERQVVQIIALKQS